MLGYVDFPPIERQPYRLTLGPYGFLWLELQPRAESAKATIDLAEQAPLNVTAGWEAICEGIGRQRLETVNLPEFLPKQRWFAAKSQRIKSTRIINWIPFEGPQAAVLVVEVQFDAGDPSLYLVPLAMSFGEDANELRKASPNAIVASIVSSKVAGVLYDAVFDDTVCLHMLSLIEKSQELGGRRGSIRGLPGKAFAEILGGAGLPLPVRRVSAEQSNSSLIYGDRFILKLFRHLEPGINPDAEMGRFLTEKTTFDRTPPFAGSIELTPGGQRRAHHPGDAASVDPQCRRWLEVDD